jgi:hypothetical protein
VGRLDPSCISREYSRLRSIESYLRLCKILVIPMTVALLINVDAGLGRHVWDLSYPDVVAIQRWSKHTSMHLVRNSH